MSSLLALISGNGDPYYGITQSTTSMNEGSSVVFTVTTVNVAPSTTLYWTLNTVSGTIDANDFVGGAVSGTSVTGSNGVASISLTLESDYTIEGTESFQLQVRTGSISGTIVATSQTVTVSDTSVPTYAISPSTTSANEGDSLTFTVGTNGVANGTTLYYTLESISGTVNSSDFSSGSLSGSVSISGASGTFNTGGSATISYTLSNDLSLEGTEQFRLNLRTGSTSGTIVANSSTVTISDTSVPTYSVSPSTSTVNEGSSVTFTVTTAGVPNGTTLYWTTSVISGTVNSSDFTDGVTSGSFTINSNSGSIVRTLTSDVSTEGSESFRIQIRTGSTSGTIVATSSTVTISDTSIDPSYSVTPSTTTVDEGSSVTFTINTTNVASGTTLYYTLSAVSGTINDSDFSSPANATSGSFTVSGTFANSSGTVTLTLANDASTEGNEQFTFNVRTGSTSGTIRATSSTVTIRDTSSTGTATYTIVAGGGGGGGSQVASGNYAGGGGGGGGYLTGTFTYTVGSPYTIAIGAGGGGGFGASYSGVQGSESSFGPIIAKGGGGGLSGGFSPPYPSTNASGGGGHGPFSQPFDGYFSPGELASPPFQGNPGGSGYGYSTEPNSPPVPSTDPTYGAYIVRYYALGGGGGGSGSSGLDGSPSGGGPNGAGVPAPVLGYVVGSGGGGGSGSRGQPLSSPPTYTGPGPTWNLYSSLPGGNAANGGGAGGVGPSSPGSASSAAAGNGSNASANYGAGGGGGGVWGVSPGPTTSSGGNGGSGIIVISFPSIHTATIGPGLVYSSPSATTRIFTSGGGTITFNLA